MEQVLVHCEYNVRADAVQLCDADCNFILFRSKHDVHKCWAWQMCNPWTIIFPVCTVRQNSSPKCIAACWYVLKCNVTCVGCDRCAPPFYTQFCLAYYSHTVCLKCCSEVAFYTHQGGKCNDSTHFTGLEDSICPPCAPATMSALKVYTARARFTDEWTYSFNCTYSMPMLLHSQCTLHFHYTCILHWWGHL